MMIREYNIKIVCYICVEKFNENMKNLPVITQEIIKVLQ